MIIPTKVFEYLQKYLNGGDDEVPVSLQSSGSCGPMYGDYGNWVRDYVKSYSSDANSWQSNDNSNTFLSWLTAQIVPVNSIEEAYAALGLEMPNAEEEEAAGQGGENGVFPYATELKNYYENGNGIPYHLSNKQFNEIYKTALKYDAIEWNRRKPMGDGTYSVPVNLYKTTLDLGLAFGRATMYIKATENGITPTGFYDTWDLDTKPWGTRSYPAEIITRYFDWQLNGTNFKITYP